MSTTYSVHDVYTPSRPAILTFVEREKINTRLVDSLMTPGKQIVVYGHSGSGKTTLLTNKLNQLYENHITTRCIPGATFESLIVDAFDQLDKFYVSEMSAAKTTKVSQTVALEYLKMKSSLASEMSLTGTEKAQRIIPAQLTPQRLAQFIGEAKCCWVVEDFHKIDATEKVKLSNVMKLFVDTSIDYPTTKIIAIGAVGTAREVVKYDNEMRNRVSEINVPLMDADEIKQIVTKGESYLNVNISRHAKDVVAGYSNGLAAVCHQLCLNLCLEHGVQATPAVQESFDDAKLEDALKRYVEEESDSIKSVFDMALKRKRERKFDNCWLILKAMAQSNQDALTSGAISQMIKTDKPDYPSSQVTKYLTELMSEERGAIVRFDERSGKYSFSNPFHKVYMMIQIRPLPKNSAIRVKWRSIVDNIEMVEVAFSGIAKLLK